MENLQICNILKAIIRDEKFTNMQYIERNNWRWKIYIRECAIYCVFWCVRVNHCNNVFRCQFFKAMMRVGQISFECLTASKGSALSVLFGEKF